VSPPFCWAHEKTGLGRPPTAGQLIFRGIFGRLRAAAGCGRTWPHKTAGGPYRGQPAAPGRRDGFPAATTAGLPRQTGGTDPAAGASGRSPAGQAGVTVASPVCHWRLCPRCRGAITAGSG
jgi:hypothetical protein